MQVTTIAMLTTNEPGVLARIAHLFCRRGGNLLSVCAEKARIFDQYCITVAVACDDRTLEQIRKQLTKLVDVEEVTVVSQKPYIERQVVLVKVQVRPGLRSEITEEGKLFGAHVADMGASTITFEITSDEARADAFLKALEPYGVLEVVRSGKIALYKGDELCFKKEFAESASA
jgi:acetolactate synthase-1/3 small subunit